MMKRFAVAVCSVALLASSAFATWDYFPPKDAGEGEAKLSFEYDMPAKKTSEMTLGVGARYGIIQGLEASLWLPVPLASSYHNPITDKSESVEKHAGLSVPEIGVRYWLDFGLGFFVDAMLPVDTREGREPDFGLELGVQYSTELTDQISLGSQATLLDLLDDGDIGLHLGLEVDYNLGAAAPYLGLEFPNLLADGDFMFDLVIGCGMDVTDAISADLGVTLGIAGYGDNFPVTISVSGSFHF